VYFSRCSCSTSVTPRESRLSVLAGNCAAQALNWTLFRHLRIVNSARGARQVVKAEPTTDCLDRRVAAAQGRSRKRDADDEQASLADGSCGVCIARVHPDCMMIM